MRVGLSSFVLQGGQTGIATYILNLIRALQNTNAGDEFEVIIPESELSLLPKPEPGVTPYPVSSFYKGPIRSILWHQLVLPILAKQRHYDLVHVPTARRIPATYSGKLVCTVHDMAAFHVAKKYDAARMYYNTKVIPWLLRRCDHLISVSEFTKRDLMEFAGIPEEKITVVYPGIDAATFRPMEPEEARLRLAQKFGLDCPFIVYVSRLEHPGKNHVGLIEAFRILKERHRLPHRLVLAGADWSGAATIHRMGASLGDDILFTGFVSRQDIVDMYSVCDVMVYPSLFEGFGLPVIEAAACGAKVICSASSSLKEIASTQLNSFDPRDIEELSQKIYDELTTEDLPGRRDERMAYARSFDWQRTARNVVDVYRQLA